MKLSKLLELEANFESLDWCFSTEFILENISNIEASAFNLLNYAEAMKLVGKYKSALKLLDEIALSDIPNNKQYLYYLTLGSIFEEQLDINSAINAYYKAQELNEKSTIPSVVLSNLLLRQEKFDEAEKVLKDSLRKEGDLDEVWFNLSTLFARQGKIEDAINAMNNCLDIDEAFDNALVILTDLKNLRAIKLIVK